MIADKVGTWSSSNDKRDKCAFINECQRPTYTEA